MPHSTGDETKLYFSNFFWAWLCFYFFVLWGLGAQVRRQITQTSSSSVARWGRRGNRSSRRDMGNAYLQRSLAVAISGRGFGTKEVPQWRMGGGSGEQIA